MVLKVSFLSFFFFFFNRCLLLFTNIAILIRNLVKCPLIWFRLPLIFFLGFSKINQVFKRENSGKVIQVGSEFDKQRRSRVFRSDDAHVT